MSSSVDALHDRFRGALIGTFVGDALGAPFEGEPRVEILRRHGEVRDMERWRLGRGNYTDDTELMIGLAEGLLDEGGELELDSIAARFGQGFNERRGYGKNAFNVLQLIRSGMSWPQAAAAFKPHGGSYGNGAAMRVAPVALAYFAQPDQVATVALRQGAITGHSHPLGGYGAQLQALAIWRALDRGARALPFDGAAFLAERLGADPPEEYQRPLHWIADHLDATPDEAIKALGMGVRAHKSVPTALWAFQRYGESAEEAVVQAVTLGGDCDTIGAMCGAIAGAYHGMSAFPERWLDALENSGRGRDYIVGLADEFYELRQ
jgi:poly(ADP-ribose) glycohydrolase ARH3